MLCGEDNNWTSANIGRCVLRQCPELGSVDDGVLSSNETAAGTVVEITCNEGSVFKIITYNEGFVFYHENIVGAISMV